MTGISRFVMLLGFAMIIVRWIPSVEMVSISLLSLLT